MLFSSCYLKKKSRSGPFSAEGKFVLTRNMKEETDQRYIYNRRNHWAQTGTEAHIPGSISTPQNKPFPPKESTRVVFAGVRAALTENSHYRPGFKTT